MKRDSSKIISSQYELRRRAEFEHCLAKIRIYYTIFLSVLLFAARGYLEISLAALLFLTSAAIINAFIRYLRPVSVSEARRFPPAADYLDLLFIAIMNCFTGGANSVFLVAYAVPICGGIIRFGFKAGMFAYAFTLGMTGLLYLLNIEGPPVPLVFNLLTGLGTFAFVAWLVGFQAEREWQLRDEIYLSSISDHLTGLHNQNYIKARIEEEIERCERDSTGFAISFIDLDNFRLINDQYGHLIGDKVLKLVADILAENVRKSDVLARYGGDEFILFMPATKKGQVQKVMQRVENALAGSTLINNVKISFSNGMAVFPADGGTLEQLLAVADERMYEKKGAK